MGPFGRRFSLTVPFATGRREGRVRQGGSMRRFAEAWRTHPMLAAALCLSLLATLLFGLRLGEQALRWQEETPLQGWMTIGQVAHSYDVPREDLARAVGLEPGLRRRLTLDQVAQRTGRSLAEVEAALAAEIARARAAAGREPEPRP